jgi:hypothetical protein
LPKPRFTSERKLEDQPQPGFPGQRVAVKQVEKKISLVSFIRYDLGFFDHETCRNFTYLFGIDN